MAVTKRTRFEVLRRDNYTCRYCRSAEGKLTVDHVTPVSLGGTDDPGNLVACCVDCNAGKGSSAPGEETVADVSADAVKWADAMRRAADVLAAQRQDVDDYIRFFDSIWGGRVPSNYEGALISLMQAGLPTEELAYAVRVAESAQWIQTSRFRYFCGVAWRRVRDLQDVAKTILGGDEEA